MSMRLPKVSIGKVSRKRQVFDKYHEVNTTSGFGFVQPLGVQPLTPGSTSKISVSNFVRLAAMPSPTRGSLAMHTYHRFVPIEDIFEPFQNLMTGTSYSTPIMTYVPTEVPNIYQNDLMLMFLNFSEAVCFYNEENGRYKRVSNPTSIQQQWTNFNQSFSFRFADPQHNPYWLTSPRTTSVGGVFPNPENADFIMQLNFSASRTIACFSFGKTAKNLRKILLGCGYQITLKYDRPVSLLPLIAYYKAYFDQFAPKRNATWTDTNIYKYLQYLMYNGVSQQFTNEGQFNLFKAFLSDLTRCYYTINPDYFTSHLAHPASGVVMNSPDFLDSNGNAHLQISRNSSDTLPYVPDVGLQEGLLNRVTLQMLNRFTKLVRKDSVIGKNVRELLFKLGAKPVHDLDSNYIGSSVTPCQIDNIMSNAATEDAHLGEFAGVGIGGDGNDVKTFTFDSTTYGYWITLACIVPQAGYCQCANSNGAIYHLNRFQFWTPDFDAIGEQVTSNEEFIGQSDFVQHNDTKNDPVFFGRISRYAEYKVKPNLLNGDMSARSTRSSLLPYTLDRYYAPDDVEVMEGDDETGYAITIHKRSAQTVSTNMRFLGNMENEGNFNRIFYNSEGEHRFNPVPTDNFIIHSKIDFKFIAPMVGIGDSFDTDAESDVTMNVEHE